jgi:small GTP-binding protein
MSTKFTIGVVGNPNCGKTTLFNALTGSRQRVGNWPGVTVERKTGRYVFDGVEFELVDLPGTYSLDLAAGEVSLDEQIARDYVAAREADLIVNIVDASNLERNLYLTAQLIEMRVPMLVALNMMDAARQNGLAIDTAGLAERLGCPVIPVVATVGEGIAELRSAILDGARNPHPAGAEITYAAAIESAMAELQPQFQAGSTAKGVDPRWLALRLLEGDSLAERMAGSVAGPELDALRDRTAQALGDDIDISLPTHATASQPGHLGHGGAQEPGEVSQHLGPDRPHRAQPRAGHSDLPARDVPDVHVHHQHRRRLHRLLRHLHRGPRWSTASATGWLPSARPTGWCWCWPTGSAAAFRWWRPSSRSSPSCSSSCRSSRTPATWPAPPS